MRMGLGIASVALVALSACGGASAFTAKGALGIVAVDATTDDCSAGTGGYSDIREGASVVITDASGKKLAVGSLKEGKPYGESRLCTFGFSIEDIPGGEGPYSVEVGSRGEVAFTEDEADSIVISLGN